MLNRYAVSMSLFILLSSIGVQAADSPETIKGAITIDDSQAKALFEQEVAFIDVRKDQDWDAGRIPGAIHLNSKGQLSEETLLEEVTKDEKVVFYCNGVKCLRSSKAAVKAVEWGFSQVYYYRLGFPSWQSAGLPTE